MKRAVKLSVIVFVVIVAIAAVMYIISPRTQLKYAIINSTEATSCTVTYEQDMMTLNCELKSPELSLETVCNIKDIITQKNNSGALNSIQEVELRVIEDGYIWPLISAVYVRENDEFVIDQITFFKAVDSSEFRGYDLTTVKQLRISRSIQISSPDDFKNFFSLEKMIINMNYSDFDSEDIDEMREMLPECYIYFTDETLTPKNSI